MHRIGQSGMDGGSVDLDHAPSGGVDAAAQLVLGPGVGRDPRQVLVKAQVLVAQAVAGQHAVHADLHVSESAQVDQAARRRTGSCEAPHSQKGADRRNQKVIRIELRVRAALSRRAASVRKVDRPICKAR